MNNKRIENCFNRLDYTLFIAILLALTLTPGRTDAAEVAAWSLEVFLDGNISGTREVWVRCEGNSKKHYLRKASSASQWCAATLPDLCHRSKRRLAESVCADDFAERELTYREGRQYDNVNSASPYNDWSSQRLLSEQSRLQQQQRVLQARETELNRRKQDLQKRLRSLADE